MRSKPAHEQEGYAILEGERKKGKGLEGAANDWMAPFNRSLLLATSVLRRTLLLAFRT